MDSKEKINLITELLNVYPLSSSAKNNCISFIELLPQQYIKSLNIEDIYPSNHGTLFFEWVKGRELVSVEIGDELIGFYSKNLPIKIAEDGILFNNIIPNEILNALEIILNK